MVPKVYAMIKLSCKRKKNYYGPGGEKAHMSPES